VLPQTVSERYHQKEQVVSMSAHSIPPLADDIGYVWKFGPEAFTAEEGKNRSKK
jgi:hypothetical protein